MSLNFRIFVISSSSSISMPLVVEVKDRTHPVLKKHPYKSMMDDQVGAFSSIAYGVLYADDVRTYIHYEIEETNTEDILYLYTDNIMDEIGNLKPEFMQLQRKGFT